MNIYKKLLSRISNTRNSEQNEQTNCKHLAADFICNQMNERYKELSKIQQKMIADYNQHIESEIISGGESKIINLDEKQYKVINNE